MRTIILVGWREFREQVRKRAFLISTLATPAIFVVIWIAGGFFSGTQENPLQSLMQTEVPNEVIGYVDRAGLIKEIPDLVPAGLFQAYADANAARAALDDEAISAYYVVEPDYRETGAVQRVSHGIPTAPPDEGLFSWILLSNLFPNTSTQELARLRWPFNQSGPQYVDLGAVGEGQPQASPFVPFVVAIVIIIPLFTSGGYLLQSLAQEKGSRIMEILLVSLRPRQLLTGKLLGLGGLTLVQYVIWIAVGVAAGAVSGQGIGALLEGVNLSAGEVGLIIPFALGGFVLYAALMAGIGALTPDVEGSRNWVLLVTIPMTLPIYIWPAVVDAPNSGLAVVLSLFPFSAPVTMLMRMTSTSVPDWQVLASIGILLLTGVGTILLMARLFRVQTLLSGEPLSAARLWSALTG
jgi:ABC-2 type transport system permease protein